MGETINNIKAILDQIRPFLQRDGGDIEFVEYIKEALPEDVQYVEAVAF